MDFFKVNGYKIKVPNEITVSPEILDKAERTVDGTMVVDIIGMKRKLDLTWEYLSKEDMAILARETKHNTFTEVTYHDNETGELVTMTARGEGLAYMPHYNWSRGVLMWKTVTISFKER